MCIVISSTVYGTRTFAALVKMVPGSKMFPAISVMILVAMVTLSVVSDGNAFSDGTRRMFPDMSSGVSVGIPLTVGAGWNRALADVNLISSSNISRLYHQASIQSSLSSDAKPHILIPESSSPSIRDLAGNGAPMMVTLNQSAEHGAYTSNDNRTVDPLASSVLEFAIPPESHSHLMLNLTS